MSPLSFCQEIECWMYFFQAVEENIEAYASEIQALHSQVDGLGDEVI